ncbi:MAG: DJ-1/PfpI family protein [Eubacteriales bacterium]
MKKVSIFLAEGFEEVEALTPADLLRRAGAEVTLVSIGDKKEVAGSHGIIITADRLFVDTDFADADLLILPGGMPGTLNLKACDPLLELLKEHNARGRNWLPSAPRLQFWAMPASWTASTPPATPAARTASPEPSVRPPR